MKNQSPLIEGLLSYFVKNISESYELPQFLTLKRESICPTSLTKKNCLFAANYSYFHNLTLKI